MSKLQALREKRANLAKDIRGLADKMNADGYTATAEDTAAFEKAKADFAGVSAQIEREEFVSGAEASAGSRNDRPAPFVASPEQSANIPNRPEVTEEHRALAVQAWFRGNSSDPTRFPLTNEHREACERVGLNSELFGRPGGNELTIRLRPTAHVQAMQSVFASTPPAFARANALRALNGGQIGAALSGQNAATGGTIMAPESMANNIEVNMLSYSGVMQAADIMRTAGRERLRWPTVNDTSNSGRRLGESAAVTSTAQPAFAAVYWDAYKYTSDEILVPYELLSGTPFNLATIISSMLGERIGRKGNTDLTNGTGSNQPKGIVTAATSFSAAAATSISWDDLENLITAVDPDYRTGAAFMFHDSIRSSISKLKDGMGRPLWAEGPNGTLPTLLKGFPWYINQAMDSTIASGKKTILFGQLPKYKVRQVDSIRIYRLVERHRENDQDAFLAFAEMDGNLLDAGTAPVKYLAH